MNYTYFSQGLVHYDCMLGGGSSDFVQKSARTSRQCLSADIQIVFFSLSMETSFRGGSGASVASINK